MTAPLEPERRCGTCDAERPATLTPGWSVNQDTGVWACPACTDRRFPPQGCEDCGEPASRITADGVWLCEGDFALLCDQAEGIPE